MIAHGSVYLRPAERVRHPAVRDVVQRLRDVTHPLDPGADVDPRPRSSGSSTRSPTRARAATTSSPASSPTTGRSAPSACSSSTSSTAARASGSRSARPPTAARATARDMIRALLAFGVREPAARADRARLLRLQRRRPPPVPAGRVRRRGRRPPPDLPRGPLRRPVPDVDARRRVARDADEPASYAGPSLPPTSRLASALSSRSTASRNGSVTSSGSASRIESFGP